MGLSQKKKAELFDALMDQQQLRINVSKHVGDERYQHLQLQMWTRHLGVVAGKAETDCAKEILLQYLQTHADSIRHRKLKN